MRPRGGERGSWARFRRAGAGPGADPAARGARDVGARARRRRVRGVVDVLGRARGTPGRADRYPTRAASGARGARRRGHAVAATNFLRKTSIAAAGAVDARAVAETSASPWRALDTTDKRVRGRRAAPRATALPRCGVEGRAAADTISVIPSTPQTGVPANRATTGPMRVALPRQRHLVPPNPGGRVGPRHLRRAPLPSILKGRGPETI